MPVGPKRAGSLLHSQVSALVGTLGAHCPSTLSMLPLLQDQNLPACWLKRQIPKPSSESQVPGVPGCENTWSWRRGIPFVALIFSLPINFDAGFRGKVSEVLEGKL